ncbi:hypothetical protein SAMN02910356_00158 [Selenomonas sp. GACV-9]|uniref:hypothetical protein n=1 Tax=Selenomonas sp. GACV-9 TaxID=3158782 RepID=UPI0008F42870|nr:hypothetical protein SAMN02910356_00158 [Selenomonas ruminantium]
MGFRLQVSGAETIALDENMIRTAQTEMSTPADSRARASKCLSTIVVTGKLYAATEGNETMKLFNWAHCPAESADAYRDAVLTVVFAGNTFRQVHLSKAFVVDYQESYEDTEGFGTFRLVIRQKTDLVDKVTAGDASGLGGVFGGALGSAIGGLGAASVGKMAAGGCFGSGRTANTGKIMGEIARQTAETEVVRQAAKASPIVGQVTQAAGAAVSVQQAAKKSEEMLHVKSSRMNMDDFIIH